MVYPLLAYGVARGIYAYAANKPLNPIKAHDAGRWGREWTTSAIGSDFEPGASWVGGAKRYLSKLFKPSVEWGRIRTIVDPLVEKSLVTKTAEEFVRKSGVVLARGPSRLFPEEYFHPLRGKTVIAQKRAVPLLAAPEALAHRGYRLGEFGEFYRGTAVHEMLESAYALTPSKKFVSRFMHFHPDVLRGEGYFLQQTGLAWKEVAQQYRGMAGLRYMRQGWRYGSKNVPLNPIKAHTAGKWGREMTASNVDSDFVPGASWQQSVKKVIEPFVKAALKKGMTLEKFAKMAQVNLMTEASTLYPIRKFRPGAGRTVLRRSGEVTAMMTSPKELSRRGYDMLNQKVRQKWMGGVVHERLEAEFFKRGTYGRELIRELGHAHKNVPRGHGYFLQQIGMKEAQLATFIPTKDLPLVLEGFKAAEQATLRSKSIMSMIDESLIEIRGIEAVRSKKLHQAAYQETSAGLSHVMNAQRVGHRDMGY